ncbi:MAG: hypothetical protein WCL08_14505, partial [Verrucomicrobiota bacterium]
MTTPSTSRRHFLAGLTTAAASLWVQKIQGAPDPKKDTIIGHGAFRYKVRKDWVAPGQGRHHPILNCHEMVQVKDGRLFMIGDHETNQMLVFKPDGTIVESWGCVWPGGHGLTLAQENGEEFLFVTDSGLWKNGNGAYRQTGRVTKVDLNGKELLSISHPMSVGAYEPGMQFNPTETTIAPNGDIYVVDGYGSQFVLRYDAQGRFLQRFGGKDGVPQEERLNNALIVSKSEGIPLGRALVKQHLIDEEQLARAIASQHDLKFVDLHDVSFDKDVARFINSS